MKLLLDDLPIFVAHYTKLAERRARLERELASFGLYAKWLTAHDPEELTADDLHRIARRDDAAWLRKTAFYTREAPRGLKRTEVSLAMKHVAIYERVRDGAFECGLVLEDDVVLVPDFRAQFDRYFANVPPDFDFVFIGSGCNLSIPGATADQHFYEKATPAAKCTDSYLMSRRAAEDLVGALPPFNLPIDFELNYQIHAQKLKVYWLEPPIMAQGSQIGMYRSSIQ